jgi:vitamin B12 transporter
MSLARRLSWSSAFAVLASVAPSLRVALADDENGNEDQNAAPPSATGTATASPPAAEVIAFGERRPSSWNARARGVSSSVIGGDRVVQPGASTAHVLREAPGVQVTELGGLGAPATASVRGATAAQTPVYFGGIRVNDEVGGAADLADVPLFLIDRIEVYRSHAPLFADRMGIGGAIFLEPRRPEMNSFVTGAEVGSYGTRAGLVYATMTGSERNVLAGLKFSAADNDYPYFDDRGTLFSSGDDSRRHLQNADVRVSDTWLVAEQRFGKARTALLWQHNDREQGAPKLALLPSREARTAHQRELFALRSTIPIASWRGELVLSTEAAFAETTVDDPLLELGWSVIETRTPGQRVEQGFEASQEPITGLKLRENLEFSVDRLQRWERRSGALALEQSVRRLSSRLAGSAELEFLPTAFADTTVALTCVATSTGALGLCDDLEPDGRVGLSLRRTRFELYANLGRYHRLATLGELHGASLLVRGNSELLSEEGSSYEAGARYQLPQSERAPLFVADVAGFSRTSRELITYVRTAQGYLTPINRNESRAYGAEFLVATNPTSWFEASSQITLLDLRDRSPDRMTTNDVLPFSSRLTSATLLTLRSAPLPGVLDEAGTTWKWLYQSSRYADPAGLGVIPDQTSLDVEIFLHSFRRRLVTRARMANALDSRRFDIVGFPLPGRSVFASLEATW